MKSIKLLFVMIFLLVSSAFAQSYDPQYVSAQMGDTLVVKGDNEFGGSNTLYLLMASDTLAPAGRVYMQKTVVFIRSIIILLLPRNIEPLLWGLRKLL